MLIYISIFCLKLLENAIGTIRMIVATNGKKMLGAILQFLIGLVWILSASLTISGSMDDPIKIFIFAIGSAVGSYVGCLVEEKIAMGESVLFCITNQSLVLDTLHENEFSFTVLLGSGIKQENYVILIAVPRKRKKNVIALIKEVDERAMIISECADSIYGGNKNVMY